MGMGQGAGQGEEGRQRQRGLSGPGTGGQRADGRGEVTGQAASGPCRAEARLSPQHSWRPCSPGHAAATNRRGIDVELLGAAGHVVGVQQLVRLKEAGQRGEEEGKLDGACRPRALSLLHGNTASQAACTPRRPRSAQ